DLVAQPDAAAFLHEVNQHAAPFARDPGERGVELGAAIAAQAAEHLAGEARRVYAREHALAGHLAQHHRDVLLVAGSIYDDANLAMLGRQTGLGVPRDHAFGRVWPAREPVSIDIALAS